MGVFTPAPRGTVDFPWPGRAIRHSCSGHSCCCLSFHPPVHLSFWLSLPLSFPSFCLFILLTFIPPLSTHFRAPPLGQALCLHGRSSQLLINWGERYLSTPLKIISLLIRTSRKNGNQRRWAPTRMKPLLPGPLTCLLSKLWPVREWPPLCRAATPRVCGF